MNTDTLTEQEIDILTNVVPELNIVPQNAPKPEELDAWEKNVGKTFFKFDAKTGNVDKRLFFVVDNMWPESHASKNAYTVNYRYHVFAHFGQVQGRTIVHPDGRKEAPNVLKLAKYDFYCDVKKFIQDYRLES